MKYMVNIQTDIQTQSQEEIDAQIITDIQNLQEHFISDSFNYNVLFNKLDDNNPHANKQE